MADELLYTPTFSPDLNPQECFKFTARKGGLYAINARQCPGNACAIYSCFQLISKNTVSNNSRSNSVNLFHI